MFFEYKHIYIQKANMYIYTKFWDVYHALEDLYLL